MLLKKFAWCELLAFSKVLPIREKCKSDQKPKNSISTVYEISKSFICYNQITDDTTDENARDDLHKSFSYLVFS